MAGPFLHIPLLLCLLALLSLVVSFYSVHISLPFSLAAFPSLPLLVSCPCIPSVPLPLPAQSVCKMIAVGLLPAPGALVKAFFRWKQEQRWTNCTLCTEQWQWTYLYGVGLSAGKALMLRFMKKNLQQAGHQLGNQKKLLLFFLLRHNFKQFVLDFFCCTPRATNTVVNISDSSFRHFRWAYHPSCHPSLEICTFCVWINTFSSMHAWFVYPSTVKKIPTPCSLLN